MIVVVDANVAVKWFVDEERRQLARLALAPDVERIAPDIVLIEVANALRTKVRLGQVHQDQAREAVADLPKFFDRLTSSAQLCTAAFNRSLVLSHPLADCLYLVLSDQQNAPLLTDDVDLFRKASETTSVVQLASFAKLLTEDVWRMLPDLMALYEQRHEIARSINPGNAFDSPGRTMLRDSIPERRLIAALAGLPREQLVRLIAVGLVGRGTDKTLFKALEIAHDMVSSDHDDAVRYAATRMMLHLHDGFAFLDNAVSDSPQDQIPLL